MITNPSLLQRPVRVHIEGWRFINHSYAVVNRNQLRWLMQDPRLKVSHFERPLYSANWTNNPSSKYPPEFAPALALGPEGGPLEASDWLFRCDFPYRLVRDTSANLLVMVHNEYQFIDKTKYLGRSMAEVIQDPKMFFFTPTRWSARALWEAGVPYHRVLIASHGVDLDPNLVQAGARAQLRAKIRLEADQHVFLNVGAGTFNKGLDMLLDAFAVHHERFPRSRMIVKGSDELYGNAVNNCRRSPRMGRPEVPPIPADRVIYVGGDLSDQQLQSLYALADTYVSPYRAEGFNMPVLEGLAYGMQAIVTAGGSTDDFACAFDGVHLVAGERSRLADGRRFIEPDFDSLVRAMDAAAEASATKAQDLSSDRPTASVYQQRMFHWAKVTGELADQLWNISQSQRTGLAH